MGKKITGRTSLMTYGYIALFICLSGILPIFPVKNFNPRRLLGAAGLATGCTVGLIVAITGLYSGQADSFSYQLAAGLPFSFKIDKLSLFFLVPIFLVGTAGSIFSYHYLDKPLKRNRVIFHYLFLGLLIVSMMGVVLAGSIISFAFFWEMMSVTSAVLVLFDYEKDDNRRAAFRYFIYTQAGGLFIFLAFGLLLSACGTFDLASAPGIPTGLKLSIFSIASIGFGSKAGLIPLHVWLPHAHPAAPSHVSALMSGVMTKLGIYGLLRFYLLLSPDPALIGKTFIIAGTISGLLGIIYALGQQNLKRLLAYSTLENVGIIFIGCGVGLMGVAENNPVMAGLGLAGGLLHIWNHALFKSILFLGAGCIQRESGTLNLNRMGGLLKQMPTTGILFLIGAVAICGLPPLNGFISEFLIYSAGFQGIGESKPTLIFAVMVILSLAVIGGLAIICFTKAFGVAFLGEPRKKKNRQIREAGFSMIFPMAGLALFCFAIGLLPTLFIYPSFWVTEMISNQPMPTELSAMNLCGNIACGGAAFLVLLTILYFFRLFLYRGKNIGYGSTWSCGFSKPSARMQYSASSYARSTLLLFQPFTRLEEVYNKNQPLFPSIVSYRSRFHDLIELFGEKFIGSPLTWFSARLRFIQHGNIQLYIAYIVLAVVILLFIQIR